MFPGKTPEAPTGHYELREPSGPDGSGKIYLGREIAKVLHTPEVPEWLERPDRESEEFPNRVIQALELKPDDVIADIGAGTGYFSFRFSPHVPQGSFSQSQFRNRQKKPDPLYAGRAVVSV